MSEPNDKTEAKERPKKPPGYRKFAKLLKQVVKAPPMPRITPNIPSKQVDQVSVDEGGHP
jgi:hypothetical protein